NRLVNMKFVRREAGRYYFHPVDQAYAFSRIPAGDVSDRKVGVGPKLARYSLLHRAAEYYKQARLPRKEWKALAHLGPQLAEFDFRCAGRDFETAGQLLNEIGPDYLSLWGANQLLAELGERLDGKLVDLSLRLMNSNFLGHAYTAMGRYPRAIEKL